MSEVGAVNGNGEVQEVTATWDIRYCARCNSGIVRGHLVQCIDERALRLIQAWYKSYQ